MTRWILAAEVDKIQDFVFRSAHLHEVMGASVMLTRFCDEEPKTLLREQGLSESAAMKDILVADGGSFSVLFDERAKAEDFGRKLAERYRAVSGSTL
ncbi:MAG: hypothetical protein KIT87_27850, partial [Anaerolineae bacterium]|nr:hypothetical protein [Anaerolineae bacterium]